MAVAAGRFVTVRRRRPVASGERFLPQGAPTSPAITNIICRGLDARLSRSAEQLGFRYTRYADDITFSGGRDSSANIGKALRRICFAVEKEGFQIHPDKTRLQRPGCRHEVTGLTVNQRVNVPRHLLRRFRATLHQIEKDGPAGKQWGRTNDVIAAIEGFANFVRMVDAERGRQLMQQVERIIDRHGRGQREFVQRNQWKDQPRVSEAKPGSTEAATGSADQIRAADIDLSDAADDGRSAQPNKAKKPWWKFW